MALSWRELMRILVLGSGGREHALVWKLMQGTKDQGTENHGPGANQVWCAPGNAGIETEAECRNVDLGKSLSILVLADSIRPDLVVVGPELPLVVGAADDLRARGLNVVGPGKAAAQLEGSKVFAKEFMARNGVPTAKTIAVAEGAAEARKRLEGISSRVVIKADGLCAGKGVLVSDQHEESDQFVRELAETSAFKSSSGAILLEEALQGEELSYIIMTDGERFVRMAPARDYKRLLKGDAGPNTGGMGSYSDDELLPAALEKEIVEKVVRPTLSGLRKEGLEYRGFLYFGLMLTPDGPKVLEYNCRLGDPETQSIMLRADFDLAECLASVAAGKLDANRVRWLTGASVCVVMASGGYPGPTASEEQITGLEVSDRAADEASAHVFHSGTKKRSDGFYTAGGRVLGVSAFGRDLKTAREAAYYRVSSVWFRGNQFRTDIAAAGLNKTESDAAHG